MSPEPSSDQLVTKPSPFSVADTVARLSALIADKGIKLFGVIDHSGEAHTRGLELRDTKVVMFGNPEGGTPVMQVAPQAALDLPLKVLVWDDEGHEAHLRRPGRGGRALRRPRRSPGAAQSDPRADRRRDRRLGEGSPAPACGHPVELGSQLHHQRRIGQQPLE